MKNSEKRTIIGIDPGTSALGYGIIEISNNKIKLINLGIVHLVKYETQPEKLHKIFTKVTYLIDTHKPDELAIEAPFFGKNVQSMLKLGRAQGVCMAAALVKNLSVFEYSPKKIKMAITGNGNSSKEQVAAMLQRICAFDQSPKFLDATDGLAAAVCHHYQNKNLLSSGKSFKDWKSFIGSNPKRVKNKD